MRVSLFALVFLSLFSCASKKAESTLTPLIDKEVTTIRPGEVKRISIDVDPKKSDGDVFCKGEKIPSYLEQGKRVFYVVESYFSELKPFVCLYEEREIKIHVEKKEFPFEELKVDQKRVDLSKNDLARYHKEQEILKKIYAASPLLPLFSKPFTLPMKNIISSDYGKKRLFNKKRESQHLGTDFKSFVGEKVFSSNAGKVVFAGDLFFSGGTVIIDHGLFIFSMYGHLSKVKVKVGNYVPKGTLVGLTGATGRVTGPHLHWGIKIYGNWIDGVSLIKETESFL